MPEGDTLFRTAAGLRPHLVGRAVTAARATRPGPQIERVVGSTVDAVESHGKNLVIRFDNGLELRTHMRMNGSWHRYRPGERWRRPPARARVVLEVPGAVAVCFDAPVVELFEQRAEGLHPGLATLGPDLLDPAFGEAEAAEGLRRLRDPARAGWSISAALLDQRAVAGHRQHLAQRDAVRRARRPVGAGREPRRRHARAPDRDRPRACSPTALEPGAAAGRRCASIAARAGHVRAAAR